MSVFDDFIKLNEKVLEVYPRCYDNPNGGYETTCPYCGCMIERGGGTSSIWGNMDELPHDSDCAYTISKNILSNLKLNRILKIQEAINDDEIPMGKKELISKLIEIYMMVEDSSNKIHHAEGVVFLNDLITKLKSE